MPRPSLPPPLLLPRLTLARSHARPVTIFCSSISMGSLTSPPPLTDGRTVFTKSAARAADNNRRDAARSVARAEATDAAADRADSVVDVPSRTDTAADGRKDGRFFCQVFLLPPSRTRNDLGLPIQTLKSRQERREKLVRGFCNALNAFSALVFFTKELKAI